MAKVLICSPNISSMFGLKRVAIQAGFEAHATADPGFTKQWAVSKPRRKCSPLPTCCWVSKPPYGRAP
jgi:hypothetical protein